MLNFVALCTGLGHDMQEEWEGAEYQNYYGILYYLFKLQMGFYRVAVYYNKTQHTNNTPH
jgi:hypothetical protein